MPTRYLKAGIRDSESIDNLSPQAENLFYRLLVSVDDYGRFDARPAMIKANCFPIKDFVSINKCKDLLEELEIKEKVYKSDSIFDKNIISNPRLIQAFIIINDGKIKKYGDGVKAEDLIKIKEAMPDQSDSIIANILCHIKNFIF
jgi:hypothetical protein